MSWTTDPPQPGHDYMFLRPVRVGGPLDKTERRPTHPAFWRPGSDWSKAVSAGWWRAESGGGYIEEVPTNAYVRFPEYPLPAPPETFDNAATLNSAQHAAIECDSCGGGGTAVNRGEEGMAECPRCAGFGILFRTHEFGACSVTRIRELAARRRP